MFRGGGWKKHTELYCMVSAIRHLGISISYLLVNLLLLTVKSFWKSLTKAIN